MSEAARGASSDRQIRRNIAVHDRIARKYEAVHDEIFNDVEQGRLRESLLRAKGLLKVGTKPPRALDMGCGSGNLTSHLLKLGFAVTAADVSKGFLDLVRDRYPAARVVQLDGDGLSNIGDESFELVATYSVLHHIPDYLAAVDEMARVCSPGGIVYIDHELAPAHWSDDGRLARFRREAERFEWRKYLRPMNYVHRIRRMFDPRHANEGDIHVWPDDHIEWDRIERRMDALGFDTVIQEDYLLCRGLYRRDVYDRYAGRLADTRVMAFRRRIAG